MTNGNETAAMPSSPGTASAAPATKGYETRMVLITSMVVSTVAADRYATGYLGPYLVDAFNLSKAELGAIYSVQAVAVAIAGYGAGWLSDRMGRRTGLLVPLLILAAIAAIGVLPVQACVAPASSGRPSTVRTARITASGVAGLVM